MNRRALALWAVTLAALCLFAGACRRGAKAPPDPSHAVGSTVIAPPLTALPPSGAAGGALTGTFPNPGVNVGAGASVTGTLPAANQAAQTCTGDVTGNTGATVVSAISGSTPISITPATLQWATGTASPTLTQASESTATKGADLNFTPQQSTHTTDQGGGNAVFNLEVPTGAGVEALLETKRGANFSAGMGPLMTAGATFSALYLGPSLSPSSTNFALTSNGTNLTVNAPGAGTVSFAAQNGTAFAAFNSTQLIMLAPVSGNSTTPFHWLATASPISCSTGGTQTVTAAQAGTPGLAITSGTLSSDCTIDFSTNGSSGWYQIDVSGSITLNGHNLVFKNGTQSQTYSSIPTKGLVTVYTHGANTCVTAP